MQGFFDLSDRQRGLLFHRALSRSQILYGKVLAALVIYLIAVAIPSVVMALYFARVGLQYLPVDPIQLLPTWGSALQPLPSIPLHCLRLIARRVGLELGSSRSQRQSPVCSY